MAAAVASALNQPLEHANKPGGIPVDVTLLVNGSPSPAPPQTVRLRKYTSNPHLLMPMTKLLRGLTGSDYHFEAIRAVAGSGIHIKVASWAGVRGSGGAGNGRGPGEGCGKSSSKRKRVGGAAARVEEVVEEEGEEEDWEDSEGEAQSTDEEEWVNPENEEAELPQLPPVQQQRQQQQLPLLPLHPQQQQQQAQRRAEHEQPPQQCQPKPGFANRPGAATGATIAAAEQHLRSPLKGSRFSGSGGSSGALRQQQPPAALGNLNKSPGPHAQPGKSSRPQQQTVRALPPLSLAPPPLGAPAVPTSQPQAATRASLGDDHGGGGNGGSAELGASSRAGIGSGRGSSKGRNGIGIRRIMVQEELPGQEGAVSSGREGGSQVAMGRLDRGSGVGLTASGVKHSHVLGAAGSVGGSTGGGGDDGLVKTELPDTKDFLEVSRLIQGVC